MAQAEPRLSASCLNLLPASPLTISLPAACLRLCVAHHLRGLMRFFLRLLGLRRGSFAGEQFLLDVDQRLDRVRWKIHQTFNPPVRVGRSPSLIFFRS